MNLKGTEFMSVEIASLITFWGRPEGQCLAAIFSGGGQASVDDGIDYLGNDMSQVILLICLKSKAKGLLTLGHYLSLSPWALVP